MRTIISCIAWFIFAVIVLFAQLVFAQDVKEIKSDELNCQVTHRVDCDVMAGVCVEKTVTICTAN